MKKEFCWIILILALLTSTQNVCGSAASTFNSTAPMAITNTNTVPSALMLPTDTTNIVEIAPSLTFAWNPVSYEFGPLTYDLGSRTNPASNFVSFANTAATNYTTTNVPVDRTEYAVQAVSTNLIGTNYLRSIWSLSVFFPPPPATNVYNIVLLSAPSSTSTNWVVVTNLASWTNPPTIMPGVMKLWALRTNAVTTNITELSLLSSTALPVWSKVSTVARWTNSPPATSWKLTFSKTSL